MENKITINDVDSFCFNNINNNIRFILNGELYQLCRVVYGFCNGATILNDRYELRNCSKPDYLSLSLSEIWEAMNGGRLVVMMGDLDKLQVLKLYKDTPNSTSPKRPKTRWEHKLEFIKSFEDSIDTIGGDKTIINQNMTLAQMAEKLAQNGLRFTYLKKEEM